MEPAALGTGKGTSDDHRRLTRDCKKCSLAQIAAMVPKNATGSYSSYSVGPDYCERGDSDLKLVVGWRGDPRYKRRPNATKRSNSATILG